jgi:signal transduction histidine kinase/CheY-like chemotaxis protein
MRRDRLIQPYSWTIIVIGLAVSVFSVSRLPGANLNMEFVVLALGTIFITSRLSIQIPRVTSHITVSDTFVFLIMLLYGGEAATLVAALEGFYSASLISRKPRTLLLGASILAVSTFLTGTVRAGYLSYVGSADSFNFSPESLIALCLMALVQYLANSWLAAIYEGLKANKPIWHAWSRHYLWTSISFVVGASGAAVTAMLVHSIGFYATLVTTPIIGIIFFTYRTYLQNIKTAEKQAEQAQRHVEELNHYIQEQERIREQFSQVEKMSALGVLASGVAHDFNNMLASILGRAELMMKHTQDPKLVRGLDIIIKSAEDGAKVVKRIQDFARQRRDNNFEIIDVDKLLLDVSEITRPRWKDHAAANNVHIQLDLRNDSGAFLMGDVSELRDVLVNIIFNAVDAMPAGGHLTLAAEVSGDDVNISVTDTGKGMTPEVRSRIFDPFFTTKGVEGMGLGLAVSYGIISRHEGAIEVESEVGRGSTFRIKMPAREVAEGEYEAGQHTPRKEAKSRLNMIKILVVDDEERVRELLREILEDTGYEVAVAGSGREGLTLFDSQRFDAVFTDLGMPGMSGWELARAIRERDQKLPLAVITGWGEAVATSEKESAQVDWILTKPFSMAQIINIVQEVSKNRNQLMHSPLVAA